MPTPKDEWVERVRYLTSGASWIIDGNYSGTLSIRLQSCDAIVFFDIPRLVCVKSILRRWVVYQFKARSDLPEGCPEQINTTFLRWVWDYPTRSRPKIVVALREASPEVEVLRITRRAQARDILNSVSQKTAAQPRR